MSYSTREISTQDGRPIALYEMRWGETFWRYTSADRDVTITQIGDDNQPFDALYQAKAISDRGMVQGSSSQNDFTVEGPSDLPIVALYRGTPPSESITLTVRRIHVGETDAPIYWKGTVTNVVRPDIASCSITGRPISASLKRTGLRLCWTRECPHFIYDAGCKLNPEDWKRDADVVLAEGNVIIVNLTDVDNLRGGFISWEASAEGTIERRFIEDVVANPGDTASLTIFGLAEGLVLGQAVKVYPSCDRLPDTCDGVFDNIDNYGGFKDMPGDTPFGSAIW